MSTCHAEGHRAATARRRQGVGLAVLVLHGLVLLGWQNATRPQLANPPLERAVAPLGAVQWIWLSPPATARTSTPTNEAPTAAAIRATRTAPAAVLRQPASTAPTAATATPQTAVVPTPVPTVAAPGLPATKGDADRQPSEAGSSAHAGVQWLAPAANGASAADPGPGRLLDSAASRQAIRAATRGPLLAERAAQATGLQPGSAADKLARDTAAAGLGDCIKGEFAGAGMGLLSLPFLALAAASGRCAR